MLTFNEIVDTFSRINPNKVVVNDENRKITYKELSNYGNLLSLYLFKLGLRKGDRVAFLAHNCAEYAEIFYATSKVRALIVPVNFRLGMGEIVELFKDAKPKFFIFQSKFKKVYAELLNKSLIRKKNCISINNNSNNVNCTNYKKIFIKKKKNF